MDQNDFNIIFERIDRGEKCHLSREGEEWASITTLKKSGDGAYTYSHSVIPKYDVMAPSTYDERTFSSAEALWKMLTDFLGPNASMRISFVNEDDEKARIEAREALYRYLYKERRVYVVMAEDKAKAASGGKTGFIFYSVFPEAGEAEKMVAILREKDSVQCYCKPLDLSTSPQGTIVMKPNWTEHETLFTDTILRAILKDVHGPDRFFGQAR